MTLKRNRSNPWAMTEIQDEFERVIKDATDRGTVLSESRTTKMVQQISKRTSSAVYKALQNTAATMLDKRRKDEAAFER